MLTQADLIVAIGQSTNEIGQSPYSEPSLSTVLVSQAPRMPLQTPVMVLQETTYIIVSMPEITGFVTGGSPVLSYNLQYRGETAPPAQFTTLIGEVPDNMFLEYSKSGLVTDRLYQFRYRIRNKHGWGPFSDYIAIRTAKIPDAMEAPQF